MAAHGCPGSSASGAWTVSSDGKIFEWDGAEKFDDHLKWLKYLYYMFFSKWQVTMKGCISWEAQDKDTGSIRATPFVDGDGMRRTRFSVTVAGDRSPAFSFTGEKALALEMKNKVVIPLPDPATGGALTDLPVEILTRIACFMEAEEVMRFRAVCKRAYACCTSETFRREWCENWQQQKLGRLLFVIEFEWHAKPTCYKLGKESREVFPITKLVPAAGYSLVSASGGLICCCNSKKNSIVVGNPVTNQWVELPPCPLVKLTTWHFVSYPDSGDAGCLFFVVVDTTCKCWFNSKLGTWNLGEGLYGFTISSANLLRFGEDGEVYALARVPPSVRFNEVYGLVQLNLEDVAASRLLFPRWDPSTSGMDDKGSIVLLEHRGRMVLRAQEGAWALERSGGSWEVSQLGDDEDDLAEWGRMPLTTYSSTKYLVLRVDVTLASASVKMDVDKQCCATRYWGH